MLRKQKKDKLNPKQAEKIKFRAKIKETENRKSTEKNNETKSWFFEKNKIQKPLVRFFKKKTNY